MKRNILLVVIAVTLCAGIAYAQGRRTLPPTPSATCYPASWQVSIALYDTHGDLLEDQVVPEQFCDQESADARANEIRTSGYVLVNNDGSKIHFPACAVRVLESPIPWN